MRIDVWADFACPWCAIGHHRLRQALEGAGMAAEVVHHAYELDPGRRGTGPVLEHLRRRYGEAAPHMVQRVQAVAAADGLAIRPGDAVAANTFDAHRLALWAQERGMGPAVVDRLFRAHFQELLDLSDRAVLARCAQEAGLPRADAEAMLAGDRLAQEVRADEAAAQAMGVGGVPFFVFDGRAALSGAQPVAVFQRALHLA